MVGKPVDIAQVIQTSGRIPIGTVAVPQARMVIQGRRGWRAVVLVDDLLWLPVFEMVAPGKEETDAAYAAFIALGEGSGHPAGLNFGDVFSCALARARNLPLLYKDNDFARTDIVGVLRGSTGHP
jgi:ribonuclease VapC